MSTIKRGGRPPAHLSPAMRARLETVLTDMAVCADQDRATACNPRTSPEVATVLKANAILVDHWINLITPVLSETLP